MLFLLFGCFIVTLLYQPPKENETTRILQNVDFRKILTVKLQSIDALLYHISAFFSTPKYEQPKNPRTASHPGAIRGLFYSCSNLNRYLCFVLRRLCENHRANLKIASASFAPILTKLPTRARLHSCDTIFGISSSFAPSFANVVGIPMLSRKFSKRLIPSRAVVSGDAKFMSQPHTRTANCAKRFISCLYTYFIHAGAITASPAP